MPPRHIVLVGAGNGNSPWVQWMFSKKAPSVTLVEADEGQIAFLQRNTEQQPEWRVRKLVVATETAPVTFHVASVTSESGLLDPELLRGQWPNIKTRETHTRQGIALADVLQDDHAPTNWLLLDCLPALPILQGAGDQLANIDVLVVRALFDSTGPSSLGAAHEQNGLLTWLADQGLRHMTNETGRHPALGHALFVRDISDRLERAHAKQLADLVSCHTAELQTLHVESSAEHNRLREELDVHQQQLQNAGNRLAQAEMHHKNLQQANQQLSKEHATALQRFAGEMARLQAQVALIEGLQLNRPR